MVITKLILHRYKRFLLSNIETLTYTPHQSIQMIASRNLSGKSSLLKQLNPLPADIKRDFKEEGYKHIEITHNNNNYILISKENKHNFIFNNQELNQSGIKKIQLELVKDHFNITPEIMDIIYNDNKFTLMSPNERKYWLTQLSNIDYTFSINTFKRLKQRHRDLIGTIKTLKDEQVQNELNHIDKDTISKLQEDSKYLNLFKDHVNRLFIPIDKSNINLDTTLANNLLKDIELDTNNLNIKSLENELTKSKTLLETTNKDITTITKEIAELNNIAKLDNLPDLEKKYSNLEKEYSTIINSIPYPNKEQLEYSTIYTEYTEIHPYIVDVINNLTVIDYIVEHPNREEILDRFNKSESVLNSVNNIIKRYKDDIFHLEQHKKEENKISCEKCNHTMYFGYNENTYLKLKKELEEHTKKYETLNIEYLKLDKLRTDYLTYKEIISKIKNYISSKPILIPIFKYYLTDVNPNNIKSSQWLTILNTMAIDLEKYRNVNNIRKELLTTKQNIDNLLEIKKLHTEYNKDKYTKLVNTLEELVSTKNKLITSIKELENSFNIKTRIISNYKTLQSNIKQYYKDMDNNLIEIRNSYLLELINYLNSLIIDIENKLYKHKKSLELLEITKKKIEEYSKIERVLNIVCLELSPNKGLIAKSINGFINTIIEEMNIIINSIWSYNLEILPCEILEDDLDYKFKVRVDNTHTVEDISKLSSSGLEIVELAFRIVFTKYMGLTEIPLFLDEFGNTFDKEHRSSAYRVIDKILTSDFRQIFIVCHFESIYSSLKNIDFNVLDANNIDLDPSINTNEVLQIKYYE